MKSYVFVVFTLLSFNQSFAAHAQDEDSSLLGDQQKERKYSLLTHQPHIFRGIMNGLRIKSPIYKILPLEGPNQGKPFYQDIAQKFGNPKTLSSQQIINFFGTKEQSIVIGQDEVVVGMIKACDLAKFIPNPIFVGTIKLSDKVIHLRDLPENEADREYLGKGFHAAKYFFVGFDVIVHNEQTTFSEIDTLDEAYYEDSGDY